MHPQDQAPNTVFGLIECDLVEPPNWLPAQKNICSVIKYYFDYINFSILDYEPLQLL